MRRQVRKSFREVVTLDGQANFECIILSVGLSEISAKREEISECDSNLTQSGPPDGKTTFGLDARSRDISCNHGMPCEKPTRHSLALEATTQQGMVRSYKVHVVGVTLARALFSTE